MEGEVIKELAERFREPIAIGSTIAAPNDWKLYDPNELIKPAPAAKAFGVSTLGAIRDYLKANRDGLALDTLVVHVETPSRVTIGSALRERSRDRELFVTATAQDLTDSFIGQWMTLEAFVIGLQVRFVDEGDRNQIMRLLSNVSGETVKTSLDDGVSQVLEARVGVVTKSENTITNPVNLTPYRTFRDVLQPSSPFILRFQAGTEGTLPKVALMEADGGTWKLTAISRVHDWLEVEIPEDVAILA